MIRYLLLPAVAATVLIPDWASAFWRRGGSCPAYIPARPVQCYPPAYYYQPVYSVPVYPAAPTTTPTAPQVVPERGQAVKPSAPNTASVPKPAMEAKTKPVEPLKLKEPPEPSIVPPGLAKQPEPTVPSAPIAPVSAQEEPKFNLPLVEVPAVPPPLKKMSLEPLPAPRAVESVPAVPKAIVPNDDVPPFLPAVPNAIESKFSPRHDEPKPLYDLFPVDGAAPSSPDAIRTVTFHNFTGKDIALTVNGKVVTLPSKHTVEGRVSAKFTMQVGGGGEAEVTLPASVSAADVVLKK